MWTKASEISCGSCWDLILFQTSRLCFHFYFQVSRFWTYFDECFLTLLSLFLHMPMSADLLLLRLVLLKNKPLASMKLFHVDSPFSPFPIPLFFQQLLKAARVYGNKTPLLLLLLLLLFFFFFFLNLHFLFMLQTQIGSRFSYKRDSKRI